MMILIKIVIILAIVFYFFWLLKELWGKQVNPVESVKKVLRAPISWLVIEESEKRGDGDRQSHKKPFQFIVKIMVSLIFVLVTAIVVINLWHMDVDLAKTLTRIIPEKADKTTGFLKVHEKDALVQDGRVVARTNNVTINQQKTSVHFDYIYDCEKFDHDEVTFFRHDGRNMSLKFIKSFGKAAMYTLGAGKKGPFLIDVSFEIMEE